MAGILVAMLIALIAAVRGPTAFDRILAVNMFGTKTVLFIAVRFLEQTLGVQWRWQV